jgi:hypothetical protein
MNPPDPSGPDGKLPRLAGFADGELYEKDRRQVAEWVDSDTEAAEILHAQEQFTPANTEFWAAVAPPQPDEAAWDAVHQAVVARLSLTSATPCASPASATRRWNTRPLLAAAAGIVLAVLTGLLALGVTGTKRHRVNAPPTLVHLAPMPREVAHPLEGFAVLEIAGPEDVLIEAVRGAAPAGGFVVDSPCCGPMPLAGPGDVVLVNVGPGPGSGIQSSGLCPRPGDSPMIYAAGPHSR